MTRRERLMATLQGKPVDRPAVCFYELNGFDENPDDPDRFNIFSHPSWQPLLQLTREKTDRIVMIDTPDPLCLAALLFEMGEYTVTALTEPARFHRLLERFASVLLPKTEEVARLLPGRLWRIYGPEFASTPYLPPALFRECVCRHVRPMIDIIHRYGGYARVHSHGRLKAILDDIAAMGPDALDPIEPPPQGDVELSYVRQRHGQQLVLFGNLEIADLENMPTAEFAERVKRTLAEGTAGTGRVFVLMPSSSPYGRELSARTLKNYETILQVADV